MYHRTMEEAMQQMIIEIMNSFGYFGITMLIILENVFPPIPSEVILTFGGFMTTYTSLSPVGVIFFSTVGATAGALILYYVGRLLPQERMEKIVDGKVGKVLGFKKDDVGKAVKWFDKKGIAAVFLCRCVPIVRSLISIPAGMSAMDMTKFVLYTFAGSLVWNTVLVFAGAAAGASWDKIAGVVDTYSTFTLIALVILTMVGIVVFLKKHAKKNSQDVEIEKK